MLLVHGHKVKPYEMSLQQQKKEKQKEKLSHVSSTKEVTLIIITRMFCGPICVPPQTFFTPKTKEQ